MKRRFITRESDEHTRFEVVDTEGGDVVASFESAQPADEMTLELNKADLDESGDLDELRFFINTTFRGIGTRIIQDLVDRGFSEDGASFVIDHVQRGRTAVFDTILDMLAEDPSRTRG